MQLKKVCVQTQTRAQLMQLPPNKIFIGAKENCKHHTYNHRPPHTIRHVPVGIGRNQDGLPERDEAEDRADNGARLASAGRPEDQAVLDPGVARARHRAALARVQRGAPRTG